MTISEMIDTARVGKDSVNRAIQFRPDTK